MEAERKSIFKEKLSVKVTSVAVISEKTEGYGFQKPNI